jgi:hypothetical protein
MHSFVSAKGFVAGFGLLLCLGGTPVSATVIFTDDFDSETQGLNYVGFAQWTVSGGTVDLIGSPPPFFNLYPGQGRYIDMDGSTSNAGEITTKVLFDPGSYVLSFLLGGNARNRGTDTVVVEFGSDFSQTLSLAGDAGLVPQVFSFTATEPGRLSFEGLGADNVGLILDDVQLSTPDQPGQVPEPASLLVLGGGLSALGLLRRNRR